MSPAPASGRSTRSFSIRSSSIAASWQTVKSAYGPLTLVGSGFRLAEGGSGSIDRAPPLLGEHTDEILAETGYAAAEIETLREEGVV
jgi:crotonobetainyl-CoA:carnitine CoA-transferase CaiB-like acyl-CoA transferase